jgi:hypothetical protein
LTLSNLRQVVGHQGVICARQHEAMVFLILHENGAE